MSLWAVAEGQRPFHHVEDDEVLLAQAGEHQHICTPSLHTAASRPGKKKKRSWPYPCRCMLLLAGRSVVDGEVPRVSSELFSDEFQDFVAKCLIKDPKRRWSAEELLEHPFVQAKSYVRLNERELDQICNKVLHYFRAHPESECNDTTQAPEGETAGEGTGLACLGLL